MRISDWSSDVCSSDLRATLVQRPYESPVAINGLRVYVESTRDWAQNAEYAMMEDVEKDVRLSICLEGESWGPESLKFPILDYRWRASAYNNTWSSLVPYIRSEESRVGKEWFGTCGTRGW